MQGELRLVPDLDPFGALLSEGRFGGGQGGPRRVAEDRRVVTLGPARNDSYPPLSGGLA